MKTTTVVLILLMLLGCRRAEPFKGQKRDQEWHEQRISTWYRQGEEEDEFGVVDRKVLIKKLAEGPAEPVVIFLEPEDTLDLLARWSGHTVEELLKWNPHVKQKGLVAGEPFTLVITPGEFDRFSGERKAYLAEARVRAQEGQQIQDVITHTVSEGETLKDILNTYNTNLELLEKFNPKLRLTGLRNGQVLRIPLLAPKKETPALPGPKPPAPPPVPVPPPNPKPQTVDVQGNNDFAEYVVEPGDTAWVISKKKFGVTLEELEAANPGIDLERIRPGMKLKIPKKR